jgi:uncharacterized protein Yka (UPF0111/DUF47 family)
MDVMDMVSGPLVFVQRLHEHSVKVHEAVELIQPLVDALLAQDRGKMARLHDQMSKSVSEANQIKLTLYDRIKDAHFRSAGNYAFSKYIRHLNRVAEAAGDFADLLIVRETTIPVELHAAFQTLVAHVISTSRLTVNLAKELSSSEDALPADAQPEDVTGAIARITEGSYRVKRSGMEFAQSMYSLERRLDPVIIVLLDRYATALRATADAAECAA